MVIPDRYAIVVPGLRRAEQRGARATPATLAVADCRIEAHVVDLNLLAQALQLSGMAIANEPNHAAPTEERAPSDRRADIGPRKAGVWAIVLGTLLLGIVLAALDFAGRAERDEQKHPVDENAAPATAPAAR